MDSHNNTLYMKMLQPLERIKIVVRYSRTPYITGRSRTSATIWSCKKLKKYWDDIYLALYDIFKVWIPQDPLTALLGVVPEGFERRINLYLFQILLAAATKENHCQLAEAHTVPTCQSWIERVWQLYRMEDITYNLRLQREKFLKRWSPALLIMFWEKRASPPPPHLFSHWICIYF